MLLNDYQISGCDNWNDSPVLKFKGTVLASALIIQISVTSKAAK
jgi:hypothetical protein